MLLIILSGGRRKGLNLAGSKDFLCIGLGTCNPAQMITWHSPPVGMTRYLEAVVPVCEPPIASKNVTAERCPLRIWSLSHNIDALMSEMMRFISSTFVWRRLTSVVTAFMLEEMLSTFWPNSAWLSRMSLIWESKSSRVTGLDIENAMERGRG